MQKTIDATLCRHGNHKGLFLISNKMLTFRTYNENAPVDYQYIKMPYDEIVNILNKRVTLGMFSAIEISLTDGEKYTFKISQRDEFLDILNSKLLKPQEI